MRLHLQACVDEPVHLCIATKVYTYIGVAADRLTQPCYKDIKILL